MSRAMAETCNPIGEWITTAEAADLTGYHVKYVRRLVKEGRIAGRKRGRGRWVDKASVRPDPATVGAALHL